MEYLFTLLCSQTAPQQTYACMKSTQAAYIQSGAKQDYDLVEGYFNTEGNKLYAPIRSAATDTLGGALYCLRTNKLTLGPFELEPGHINFHLEF